MSMRILFLLFLAGATFCKSAPNQPLSASALTNIVFDQKLNQRISLNLEFRDENGDLVKLQNYFGQKPVILFLGYYECPMLCTIALNALIESLQDIKWTIGNEFEVVCASISPSETFPLAAAKKRAYLKRYGRAGAAQGWHFLTGPETASKQLAEEVGFHYAYDPVVKQYAHPSGFVVLTSDGKVARYFFGVSHSPKDLSAALKGASSHQIGSPIQQLFFLCFHYNPIQGKYGALIMLIIRICGGATVAGLAWLIVGMARREGTLKRQAGQEQALSPNTRSAI